ncbi:MAG: hypothetical protein JWO68_1622 [Actinomycetia bacterium]|nr:hypothetical protein [Actinomycetes bacterium]
MRQLLPRYETLVTGPAGGGQAPRAAGVDDATLAAIATS